VNRADNSQGTRRGPLFWAGVTVGWSLMLAGLRGLLVDAALTQPADLARWFFAAAIVHDILIAPAAYLCAVLVGRFVPKTAVVPVWFGLAASALLVGFAWPLLAAYGRRASNPTVLPLDYTRNVVGALVVIWSGVAVAVVVSARRHKRAALRENP
jgi:hypothetical protein